MNVQIIIEDVWFSSAISLVGSAEMNTTAMKPIQSFQGSCNATKNHRANKKMLKKLAQQDYFPISFC